MVALLLSKNARIDASTRDGLTPLHCAARSGHEGVVDLLLQKKAPISAKTKVSLTLRLNLESDVYFAFKLNLCLYFSEWTVCSPHGRPG